MTELGEYFVIRQNCEGTYCCPVCGSPEFKEAPYGDDGLASFQMCSCGFEFGFDDSSLASIEAIEGIIPNWDRWRLKVINRSASSKLELKALEINLHNIGYKLAFDLLPVKIDESRGGGGLFLVTSADAISMNREAAKNLVESEIARTQDRFDSIEYVVLEDETIEKDWGWVFFYQSKNYLESGDFRDMVVGNAPYIVNRQTGVITETGTAHGIEHYMGEYEANLKR